MADTHDTAAVPSPTPDEAERVGANLQTGGTDKVSAIPPDELTRLTDDIVAALKTSTIRKFRLTSTSSA